jgi:hypothetical protein
VLSWVGKLASHFGVGLEEDQVKIFTHALRNNTTYQVDIAFDRCLNECQFMPRLADVHQRMPEMRWPPENPGAFVLNGRPILDLVREVAREIEPNYDKLDVDTPQGQDDIFHTCFRANRLRYERMGIDCSKWDKQPARRAG